MLDVKDVVEVFCEPLKPARWLKVPERTALSSCCRHLRRSGSPVLVVIEMTPPIASEP